MIELDGLAPPIAAALSKRGYATLTAVQQAVLEPEMSGRDALVSAQTGSGKTVAFGLALAADLLGGAEKLPRAGNPLALIIAPTRELAMQVHRELEWLYEMAGATLATCVGGMDARSERRQLERGAHIVVGTPGRLRDHLTRRALDLSEIRAVVLDEADEMLDLGFREDLEFILGAAPDERRTLMFSATVPRAIEDLARSFQRNALRLQTASERKQHVDIEYAAVVVSPSDRENAIINLLRFHEARNAIVFCSTRAAVNHLTARLHNRGFSVVALSGELSQNERTHALQAMRDGRARVCIATDVAARGIDLPGLELVIHADLPTNSEVLLHRSGRTGRAGNKGISALVVPINQRRKAERLISGARVEPIWQKPPSADDVLARDEERIVADAVFEAEIAENEQTTIAALIERHGAERVAAAFVRLYRAGRSAPEDLSDVSVTAPERKKRDRPEFEPGPASTPRSREEFGAGRWFSLSIGRKQNAEPRWLIPMLCRHGQITKADIGAIKIQPEATLVEIAADSADHFLAAIGPNKTIDRGITVRPVDGQPDFSAPRRERPADRGADRPAKDSKPYADRKPARARAENAEAPARGDDLRNTDAEVWGDTPAQPRAERPAADRAAKPAKWEPRNKDKPYAGAKTGDGAKPGYKAGPKRDYKGGPKSGGPGGPGGKDGGYKPAFKSGPKSGAKGPRRGD